MGDGGVLSGISPLALLNVVVLALATFFGWSFWSGKQTIPLYLLSLTALIGVALAGVSQALQLTNLIESANTVAIAFSFAGCAAGPTLWRQEIERDLERTPRLYSAFAFRDFLSWQGVLKLADRYGPRDAGLIYLAPWATLLAVLELTTTPSGPLFDRTYLWLAHAPIAIFALLSAWYVYRSLRRLVPKA